MAPQKIAPLGAGVGRRVRLAAYLKMAAWTGIYEATIKECQESEEYTCPDFSGVGASAAGAVGSSEGCAARALCSIAQEWLL